MLKWPFSEYLVSRAHRLIYCPIPKVACSSLKFWFLLAVGAERPPVPGTHAYIATHRKRLGVAMDEESLHSGAFLKFVFVRNPLSRMVSAYVDKFLRLDATISPAAPTVAAIQQTRGRRVGFDAGVTFREFTEYAASTADADLDEHWKPQHLFLGGLNFDIVASYEHLQSELTAVAAVVGIDATIPLPKVNPSRYEAEPKGDCVADWPAARLRAGQGSPHWMDFYDDRLREACRTKYARDFRLHQMATEGASNRAVSA